MLNNAGVQSPLVMQMMYAAVNPCLCMHITCLLTVALHAIQ